MYDKVKARQGQESYRGVFDAASKIWRQEGGKAFWKGGPGWCFLSYRDTFFLVQVSIIA